MRECGVIMGLEDNPLIALHCDTSIHCTMIGS